MSSLKLATAVGIVCTDIRKEYIAHICQLLILSVKVGKEYIIDGQMPHNRGHINLQKAQLVLNHMKWHRNENLLYCFLYSFFAVPSYI